MQQQVKRLFKNKKTTIALLSFIVVTIVLCITAYESTLKTITIVNNGKVKDVQTHADTVNELLKNQGIAATSHDKVTPELSKTLNDHMKVTFDKAQKIQFSLKGKEKTVWTTADTVQDFFNTHHIALKAHDQIKPAPTAEITSGMAVTYDPGFQVNVHVGKQDKKLWAHDMTVGEFLDQNHISLNKYDQVSPAKKVTITPHTKVMVIRVKKVTDVVKAPIKAETITKKSDQLAEGEQKVLSPGESGVIEKQFEVTYKNGEEVSRKLESKNVLKKSKSKVIALGTKAEEPQTQPMPTRQIQDVASHIEPMSAPAPHAPTQGKVLYVNSTAYTANCRGCSGRTTTGINLKANPNAKVIAVDPSVIPLGSKVYVEGYGYAIAGDTGGAIGGHKIDVFFSSKSAASKWGSHQVKIKVIN